MESMRTTLVLALFLSLQASLTAHAEKANLPRTDGVCELSRVADAYFSERSRVIRFPDRREITVIGLNHGNRDLRGGSADRLSKAKSENDLRQIVNENAAAARDARESVRFLKSSPTKWIATEAAPETVKANLQTYASIEKRLKVFGEPAISAMMLGFGSDFYVRLTDPRVNLVGAEDASLGETYLRVLPEMDRQGARLRAARFDEDTAARLSEFLNGLAANYSSFRPESDDSVREARRRFTAQDFAKIEPFLKARLEVMRAMKARDRHDVDSLLKLNRSVILVIGSSHLDSIALLLRDACVSIGAK